MIVLGLTGSIGMGKSKAASMLKLLRVPVHNSDHAVHYALSPKGDAFEAVAVMFPYAWDKKKHVIDRKKLGEVVFNDAAELKKLEAILHPLAQKSQQDFVRAMKARGRRIVALEIPLLFETGAENRVDYTITVSAPPAIQRRRVMMRPNMTEEKFQKILARQMPDDEKRAKSDFVVPTGMGYAATFRALQKIVKDVKCVK